jgi:predicted phosphodiesterase
MNKPAVLYCGDPHGRFGHIVEAVRRTGASTIVLLGDLEPARPLHLELRPLIERGTEIYWIAGNHDSDSALTWSHLWHSELAGRNIHGKVVTLADGSRLAGLGGVFREAVWHPDPATARGGVPTFLSRAAHAAARPLRDRWEGGPPRRHWTSIYKDEFDHLASLQADILVSHEAPGYHAHGFEILDTLAQQMGVKVHVHGHHHDALDSSSRWAEQQFASFGVGLRGISKIDVQCHCEVIVPGERDAERERGRP